MTSILPPGHDSGDTLLSGRGFIPSLLQLFSPPDDPSMRPPPPECRKHLEESEHWPHVDLAVLWDRLTELCSASMSATSLSDPVRVLDLACGPAHEAEMLAAFFAHLQSPAHPRMVQFHGSDLRENIIAEAQQRTEKRCRFFKELYGGRSGHAVFRWDSGDASRNAMAAESYDVVFIRHQNTWDDAQAWVEIFQRALSSLSTEGHLIITSYYDREHQKALALLNTLGAELIMTLQNPHSRVIAGNGKSMDRHLAILRAD